MRRMREFSGEDAPKREGIRRRYVVGGGRKEFGEFLSPLKGQVRKACGRRYDAFYSDLCRSFDMSTPTNSHLLQHLDQYLIPPKKIFLGEDGKLWVRAEFMPPYRLGESRHLRDEFYVDPRDGIIKKVKHRKAQYKPEPLTRVEVDKDHVLQLIDGTWFLLTMKEVNVTKTFVKPEGRDLFDCHGKMLPWERVPQWLRPRHGRNGCARSIAALDRYLRAGCKPHEPGRSTEGFGPVSPGPSCPRPAGVAHHKRAARVARRPAGHLFRWRPGHG